MQREIELSQTDTYKDFLRELEKQFSIKERVVIAIDGMAASGKTTMGYFLKEKYDADLIHMDDFFLPLHLRTPQRYEEPGGNFHRERFEEEVVKGLRKGGIFLHRIFDCGIGEYAGWRQIEGKKLCIVEGAYSCYPLTENLYDLRIFLEITPEEQRKRIMERNGEEAFKVFQDKWIPLENQYFEAWKIRETCDYIISETQNG